MKATSVRRHLIWLGVVTTAVALLVGSVIYLTTTFVLVRQATDRDLTAQSSIIADNLSAAILFNDRATATETLRASRAKTDIDAICVYDQAHQLFASYIRVGICPTAMPDDGHFVDRRSIVLVRGIQAKQTRAGTLYVQGNLDDVYAGLRLESEIVGGCLILGCAIAWLLADVLQHRISSPIVALAETAGEVSQRNDYSLRAEKRRDDEIGQLVDAFNDMLAEIGRRDHQLVDEIAERRKVEEERTAALAREREASRLKDEFLAALSHELRTPLNAILGWTQILQLGAATPEKTRRALDSIDKNARTQSRLVEDLLDLSKIAVGKLHINSESVDLAAVIRAAVDVMRPAADAKNISIDIQSRDACVVRGDANRLQQAVWNVLSNAIKFTRAGGRVDITSAHDGEDCVVTITDTGIGISPQFLPHVFERFRQADGSTTREFGGLGLGLSITHELIELHGGTILAASDGLDAGARFTIRLPRHREAVRPERAAIHGHTPRLESIRVLVVDDEAESRAIVEESLTVVGATVAVVSCGAEALERLEREVFDVLVCDIAMPEVDGFELMQSIRATPATHAIPAIAMSAFADADHRKRATVAGFDLYLAKPLDLHGLVEAVADAAKRHVAPDR